MSIQSEIARIRNNVTNALLKLAEKGVDVPANATSDDLARLIDQLVMSIPQEKTVTPSAITQTIVPDAGYTHLSKVVINAIPYKEEANDAGGTTITIG